MTVGNMNVVELVFYVLVMALPFVLLVWFVRTLSAMSQALAAIVTRLAALEQAVRSDSARRNWS